MNTPVLAAVHVSKEYSWQGRALTALPPVSVEVSTGAVVAALGGHRSGKSTLIRLLAGLEAPSSGKVEVSGVPWPAAPAPALMRALKVGRPLSSAALVGHLTVREQLELQGQLAGSPLSPARLGKLSGTLGLEEVLDIPAYQLEPDPAIRAAVAVAAAIRRVILVDEADGPSRFLMPSLPWLRAAAENLGAAVLFTTSDPALAAQADYSVSLDGTPPLEGVVRQEELEALAPLPPLPPEVARVVDQAEAILSRLPGPIPDAGEGGALP